MFDWNFIYLEFTAILFVSFAWKPQSFNGIMYLQNHAHLRHLKKYQYPLFLKINQKWGNCGILLKFSTFSNEGTFIESFTFIFKSCGNIFFQVSDTPTPLLNLYKWILNPDKKKKTSQGKETWYVTSVPASFFNRQERSQICYNGF